MGKKRIKNLGKRRRFRTSKSKIEFYLKRALILVGVVVFFIAAYFTTKHIEELYKKKNIENSKI